MRTVPAVLMLLTSSSMAMLAASCVRVHVDPIYAKLDVNIKVDRELDSFFDSVQKQATTPVKATTRPATSKPADAELPA